MFTVVVRIKSTQLQSMLSRGEQRMSLFFTVVLIKKRSKAYFEIIQRLPLRIVRDTYY